MFKECAVPPDSKSIVFLSFLLSHPSFGHGGYDSEG